ncbi:hypothetical protein BH11CYA1_BH11CYA1_31760 [soil metagenome]
MSDFKIIHSDFKIIHKIEDLPLPVQIELKPYPMADADGSYQVGCVTSGPEPKPLSRLIFGALAADGKDCFVHFESGGFAHTYSVRHYSMTSPTANKATLVEGSYVPKRCATIDELQALLASVRDS